MDEVGLTSTETPDFLKMRLFVCSTKVSAKDLCLKIEAGLSKTNDKVISVKKPKHLSGITTNDLVIQICDLDHSLKKLGSEEGIDRFIIDTGFIRRKNYAVGLNGIKGYGTYFYPDNYDSARFNSFGLKIEPWKKEGDILILGQTLFFFDPKEYIEWLKKIISEVKQIYPDRKILYSPHPNRQYKHFHKNIRNIETVKPNLEELSKKSFLALGRTTNATVEMLIRGVPIYTDDKKCITYDMATRDLSNPIYPERQNWLHKLAYIEWTPSEITDGTFWKKIKPRYLEYKNKCAV